MKAISLLKKIAKSEEGFALPAALAMLLIGGLLVVPSSTLTQTSLTANLIAEELDRSIYAADAGNEYALWRIDNKIKNPGTSTLQLPALGQQLSIPFSETINGKSLTITIHNQNGTTFRIISTTTGGSERNATVISDVDLTFTGGTTSSVFDYALASLNGNITLTGNTNVESDEVQQGDIYANGDAILSGNAQVNGDASATGTITTSANARITGTRTQGATPLSIPNIDTTSYESETLNHSWGPVTHPNGWTISGTGNYTHPSPVHVTGNLSITRSGTVTFGATVCVNGNLSIGSNTTVRFQRPLKVTGNISIASNTSVTFDSTVYVGSNFSTSGNGVINLGGTVYIKSDISMSGNAAASFSGRQKVIAQGNITLTGNSQLPAEEIPFIMTTNGTITLAGNNWTSAVMYAPLGTITLSGNSKLYGSGVGQSIAGSGNSKITYPIDLRGSGLPGSVTTGSVPSGMTIRSYSIQ